MKKFLGIILVTFCFATFFVFANNTNQALETKGKTDGVKALVITLKLSNNDKNLEAWNAFVKLFNNFVKEGKLLKGDGTNTIARLDFLLEELSKNLISVDGELRLDIRGKIEEEVPVTTSLPAA